MGVPDVAGVMSMALSPSSDTDPSLATDLSVMRLRMSSRTSKATSTCAPANETSLTLPTSTPATRTGEPLARPATSLNRVFSV